MAYPRQRVYLSPNTWKSFFSHWFSGQLIKGSSIKLFEEQFAEFIGCKEAIAVPSGRYGLQLILQALDLEEDAEIIVPAFTYPAVPFVIKEMGYTVKFVDIELDSFGINPESLKAVINEKTQVILPTHLYGIPCNIEAIRDIADKYQLILVEDCAHCGSANISNKKMGTFGIISYFSLETSKCINTLGGGILTTSNQFLAKKIREQLDHCQPASKRQIFKRLLKNTFEALVTYPPLFNLLVYPALRILAKVKGPDDLLSKTYIGQDITLSGRNRRYSNFQAWIGLQQLQHFDERNQQRISNAEKLFELLREKVHCQQPINEKAQANWLLFSILLKDMSQVAVSLLEKGIDSKRYYMRDCSLLFQADGQFPNASRADQELLHLPCYAELKNSDLEYITHHLLEQITSNN